MKSETVKIIPLFDTLVPRHHISVQFWGERYLYHTYKHALLLCMILAIGARVSRKCVAVFQEARESLYSVSV